MADPGEAKLAGGEFGEAGLGAVAFALGEEGGDDDLGEEVALVPTGTEAHVHMVVRLARAAGDFFLDEIPDHA